MQASADSAIDGYASQNGVPGDGYAAQHARGFKWLRFSQPLEREYLSHMRLQQRFGALVCSASAMALWFAFMIFDLVRLDWGPEIAEERWDTLAVATMRLLTFIALGLLTWVLATHRIPASYHYLSLFVLVLISFSGALSASFYEKRNLPHVELAEFAIIMAAFLPVGLTFRQSILAAIGIASSVTVAGAVMGDPLHLAEHVRLSLLLLFAAFVGSVGAYLREHAERDQFLLRRILHQRAMFDPLTGIGNRRFFDEQAETAVKQARRERADLHFAILDVDHFKLFNDHYGHHAGDVALRRVAQTIRSSLRRPLDVTARLGGEEFGLILYGASQHEAERIVQEIVSAIAALGIAHEASPTGASLTVSAGLARFDGQEAIEHLYRRADQLLYEAKSLGRNRSRAEPSTIAQGRPAWQRRLTG